MDNNDYNVNDIQKIALHENLIGSIPFNMAKKMAGVRYVHTHSWEKSPLLRASRYDMEKFNNTYEDVSNLLNGPREYISVTYNLIKSCAKNNAIYTEIVVSPERMSINEGKICEQTYQKHMDAIHYGIDAAKQHFDIEVKIVQSGEKKAWNKNNNKPQKVWRSLIAGAERLRCQQSIATNEALIQNLAKRGILLEVCPSNDITLIKNMTLQNHPLKKLYESGVKVSISSENSGILGTSIGKEYEIAARRFNFTRAELLDISLCSIESSFADKDMKKRLSMRIFDSMSNDDKKQFKELARLSKNDILSARLMDRAKGKFYE